VGGSGRISGGVVPGVTPTAGPTYPIPVDIAILTNLALTAGFFFVLALLALITLLVLLTAWTR
jgi:hypothetical protein